MSAILLLDTPWLAAVVFVVLVLAAVVQTGLGMGFGLTAAPLLALIDPELVPAPALWLGMATAAWGAWSERHAIVWNEVAIGIAGRVAGVACAAMVLSALPSRETFMLVFGLMTAIAVILSVSGWRLPFNKANLLAMTSISGLMGTITSVGAPPLALIYQSRPADKARPTLAAFFAAGCATSLVGLNLSGWADRHDFFLALAMAPAMLLGLFAGSRLRGRFATRYRPALLATAAIAAVILVARGLA